MGKKKKQEKAKKKEKEKKLLEQGKKQTKQTASEARAVSKAQAEQKTHSRKARQPQPAAATNSRTDGGRDFVGIFHALGDGSRMQILSLLAQRELCASELLELMSIAQSTLSHHMKILAEAGLVACQRQGKKTYYSICREVLKEAGASLESL